MAKRTIHKASKIERALSTLPSPDKLKPEGRRSTSRPLSAIELIDAVANSSDGATPATPARIRPPRSGT
jgi:hypothetical protein